MKHYHVYLYPKQNPDNWEWIPDLPRDKLMERVVAGYRAGMPITNGGKVTHMEDLERIQIKETDGPWKTKRNDPVDVTDEFITGPPGRTAFDDAGGTRHVSPPTDTRQVFVVHGRNEPARAALFAFLRSIGLTPLEWSEAVNAAGQPNPYVGDILDAAFSRAHAVVVLFTPDDVAFLRPKFRAGSDPPHEIEPTGQARPNVLFEAGMAMGRAPDRTVLVEMGSLRPFSDIGGRHMLRIDNSSQQRQQLAQRLKAAGCPVKLDGTDWHTEGDFEAPLELPQDPHTTVATGQWRLGPEARSLLCEAAQDADRVIQKIRTAGGVLIRTHGKAFGNVGDARSEAHWEAAVDDLLHQGLLEDRKGNDRNFLVTREGFRTAQELSNGKTSRRAAPTEDYHLAAHRDSRAVRDSVRERGDQAFINANADFGDA